MPTLWIVHRDAGRRAVLARLSGAGEETILGDPGDRLFEGSPPADVVILGLSSDFEAELEFAHRFAPRLGRARWLLVVEGSDQADARRLFDTLDAEVVIFPPSADGLRSRLRSVLGRREVEPLSERRARDAIAARFGRWFAGLELPELLRALDPRLARTPVLIRGERGTGRSLLALYLHAFGGTAGGALVQVACQSELSRDDLLSRIRAATHGERARGSLTVVLEDVDQLAPSVQQELRGWIELGVPPAVAHSAWVRWIGTLAETPEDPAPRIDPGLRQALGAIPISLPPLRETPDRVASLAEDAALWFCERTGSRPRHFGPDALEALALHPWPGNLRELDAVVARTLAATSGEMIYAGSLRFDSEPLIVTRAAPETSRTVSDATRAATATPRAEAEEPEEIEDDDSPEDETWRLMAEALGEAEASESAADAVRGAATPGSATSPGTRLPGVAAAPPPARPAPASPADLVADRALRAFLAAIPSAREGPVVPLRPGETVAAERLRGLEARARLAEIVDTDSRRIDELAARVSRFAAFGAPARDVVDLSSLLDTLVDSQRPEIDARQILLLRELERAHPRVVGDVDQLRFGLGCLLRRALQLVKSRGDLYLASHFHPHGLRGAPSIRVLLRFQASTRVMPLVATHEDPLSETALDLFLGEATVRACGGRFTLDTGNGAETVILVDLPAPEATTSR